MLSLVVLPVVAHLGLAAIIAWFGAVAVLGGLTRDNLPIFVSLARGALVLSSIIVVARQSAVGHATPGGHTYVTVGAVLVACLAGGLYLSADVGSSPSLLVVKLTLSQDLWQAIPGLFVLRMVRARQRFASCPSSS